MSDHVIYKGKDGRFIYTAKPKNSIHRANFLILWRGKDWSGFRNLFDCVKQFKELLCRESVDDFTVVERL